MNLAGFIDHTLLKNTATVSDINKICAESIEYRFAAVCVPPYFTNDAKKIIAASGVKVATVIGFPFGYHHYKIKLEEAKMAIADGADELDMVMNIAAFKTNDLAYLEAEVEAMTSLTTGENKVLKIIIESGILSTEEIAKCCNLYRHFPVQFLKTSTGFADSGASVAAVKLMRQLLPASIQIKASGGIKNYAFAKELIEAGATRLGCSASIAIVLGEEATGSY